MQKIWLFIFTALSGLGGIACILVWLDIKPKDLWGWDVTHHWIWLILAFALFATGITVSGYNLYRSLKPSEAKPSSSEPKLKIHSAFYGSGDSTDVSVLDKLNTIERDALVVPVDNNLVSRDPAPNIVKRLWVKYSYGNASIQEVVMPEYSRLVLPQTMRAKITQSGVLLGTENAEILRLNAELVDLKKQLAESEKKRNELADKYLELVKRFREEGS